MGIVGGKRKPKAPWYGWTVGGSMMSIAMIVAGVLTAGAVLVVVLMVTCKT